MDVLFPWLCSPVSSHFLPHAFSYMQELKHYLIAGGVKSDQFGSVQFGCIGPDQSPGSLE